MNYIIPVQNIIVLNAALHYERLGWSVIPLKPKEKTPFFPWAEFQKRKATPNEIKSWFIKTPTANIGIVTGSVSRLVVVDLDGLKGVQYGIDHKLTSPLTQITGHGRQLFYKYPTEGISNSAGKIAEGVDIRGEGGYVVAPPSVHPNGKVYQFLIGVPSVVKLPALPDILFAPIGTVLKNTTRTNGWIATALEGLKNGNRDSTFTSVVGKLIHNGLDPDSIRGLLSPHALRCSFTDLDKIITSVSRYSVGQTNSPQESADIETFLQEEKPIEWICSSIIAKGAVGFVAGLPETLKTWLLMDLAVECGRGGGNWLGTFPVKGARVLFVDQERFKGETQRRFRKLLSGKGLVPADVRGRLFVRCGTTTRLNLDDSFRAFREELMELKPDLVIVDSFATFHTENENDRQSIQVVLERIKQLRNEVGCTIIFIDHETKSVFQDAALNEAPSAFRMAGSIAKPAAAEFVLTVRRYGPNESTVYHTKSTLSQTVPCFQAQIQDTKEGIIVCVKKP